ncbi:N-methyl-L-tryptophan oxidase [Natronorarus salvus]|uniref:N-methyl-L-tryptophan oxidase n=1 Tax=Natronorarus salvus TaxID=3117733 RepID=UPI002F26162D
MSRTDYDVVVLGVGGVGAATTYELARRGLSVLGLERYDVPHARGSSHGVTRIIRLAYYEDPAYVPLLRRAYDLWNRLETTHSTTLLHRTGSISAGPPGSEVVRGVRRSCAEHGIPNTELSARELEARFPGYRLPDDHVAIHQADGGYLLSEEGIVAHVEAAHGEGATIRARETVESWEASESGVRVETDRGAYTAERLVVTAGAWAASQLPELADLLVPERQVLGWFQPRKPERFAPEAFPVFVHEAEEGHFYGFPVVSVPGFKLGRYHHRGETGTPGELRREPDREDERLLREYTEEYVPDAAGPTMRLSTCLFTNTPDEHFLVDTHPEHENVVIGAGFSGHGYKFASVLGEVLSDLATEGESEHPIEPFRVSRFE